jgi:hypothetical protein
MMLSETPDLNFAKFNVVDLFSVGAVHSMFEISQ